MMRIYTVQGDMNNGYGDVARRELYESAHMPYEV